jgi:poly-gamma-glutamate synthesis protein (capsule biosynthesis protein)
MDQGATGITGTLDVLDAADLGHTGTARTESEAASAMLYELGTATIGHLSYTYALNGIPLPAGEPWRANVIDAASIARRALDLKRAGADFVVLSLHWGVEYHSEPTSQQRALAEVILEDSVVDLIVGHHAHVVQPIDQVAGKYVIYGLGNSVSNQNGRYDPGTKDGAVVTVTLGEGDHGWEVAGIEVLPTLVEYPTYRILPAASESAAGEITPALRASRGRTVNVMASRLPELITIPDLIPDAVPPAPKPVLLRLEVPPSDPPATCEPGLLLACVS